jgi:hypothetical protein
MTMISATIRPFAANAWSQKASLARILGSFLALLAGGSLLAALEPPSKPFLEEQLLPDLGRLQGATRQRRRRQDARCTRCRRSAS